MTIKPLETRNHATVTGRLAFGLALIAWLLPLTFIIFADHPVPKDDAERWIGTSETWTDRFLIAGGWFIALVALGFGISSLRKAPRSLIAWLATISAGLYAIPPIVAICAMFIVVAFRR
jgi:hypothetical protein